jgi:alginate lyase
MAFHLRAPISVAVLGALALFGSATASASTASLDPTVSPGGNFDLGIWDLQLPIGSPGSPTTIHSRDLVGDDGYSNGAYFWTDKVDGSMTFWDPEKGVTTPNSNYARSELREMNRDGSAADWSLSGTHRLSAELRVVSVTKNVCVGQIHLGSGGSSTKPLIELYYHANGDVVAGVENSPAGGQTTHTLTNVPMGQHWTYTIAVEDNQIKVTVNGNTTTYGIQGDFFGYRQYFKAGDYNQSSSDSTSNGAKVKFYSLDVSHG